MLRTVIPRSPYSGCGDGGDVLSSNTVEHNGNSINFVSGTCPQTAKRDVLEERQTVCDQGTCEGHPSPPFREELLNQQ